MNSNHVVWIQIVCLLFLQKRLSLRASLDRIKDADVERAGDVYSFYSDLDASISSVAKKTRSGGYQFWVVGNRTVKNELLQTDVIITELAPQYDLTPVYTIDRNIPNKVMPAQNSPTNISGAKGSTMTMEHIIVLRKN
jgi:site-specific DNA-methyltransferase (cytosine-N4-specific)